MSFEALWAARPTRAGCGWRSAGARARSLPTTLGDQSEQSARDLRATLPADYRRCATRSDLWAPYAAAFPARTHRCCGKEEGETNHVERWFGTLRARVGRLVRRAYSFSKCPARHLDAIHCFIATYNLAIKEQATTS